MWRPARLSEIEAKIWDLVEHRPAPGKHAARNAVFHIEKAAKITDIDPSMALFRLFTAEEEAARAIIHSLQRHRYPGSELLKWKWHSHKAAITPFLQAIGELVKQTSDIFRNPQVVVENHQGQDLLLLRFKVADKQGKEYWVYPEPPLDFRIEIDGKIHDFRPEVEKLLTEAQVQQFVKFVDDKARLRDRLLYATEDGLPRITGSLDKKVEETRELVFTLLGVFLLIDQTTQHQFFVTQALTGLLRVLERLPAEQD